ncbi:alpha/beta hydrolase [Pseudohoeflea coraliihabitans]|uniref:Alpha/beta hydrolase n=1 Tax=Pseudohoeflea coraliihabitans TaxID=2860393 RepID=A0ABS6WPW2_9HYPH|nr:alpha/beta hydrolase [Pseudohoeflea sp. DP4N28-3]MBW3098016.1 alpha/beta hydrolase [Pseudohoeflea sp. DP4N28-3]
MSLALKSIGVLIGLVSLFGTARAGRLAFRLASRAPSGAPASRREAEVLARAAAAFKAAKTVWLRTHDGLIAAYDFAPTPAAKGGRRVLVVHGYRSRSEHMLPIINRLKAENFRPVAIDLPGHGRSRGQTSHLMASVQAIDAAWREFGPFDAMVGHSFGGAAVLAAAAGAVPGLASRRPYKLAVIAAPTRLAALFEWIGASVGLSARVQAAFEGEVLQQTGKPLAAYDAANDVKRLRAEVLVLHAPDDKEVDFGQAERLAAAGPHVRLVPVRGAGHRRILRAPLMLDALAGFLNDAPAATADQTGTPAARSTAA